MAHTYKVVKRKYPKGRVTTLEYPKEWGITKKEVEKQRKQFKYPKMWILKETPKNYILEGREGLFVKHYVK